MVFVPGAEVDESVAGQVGDQIPWVEGLIADQFAKSQRCDRVAEGLLAAHHVGEIQGQSQATDSDNSPPGCWLSEVWSKLDSHVNNQKWSSDGDGRALAGNGEAESCTRGKPIQGVETTSAKTANYEVDKCCKPAGDDVVRLSSRALEGCPSVWR